MKAGLLFYLFIVHLCLVHIHLYSGVTPSSAIRNYFCQAVGVISGHAKQVPYSLYYFSASQEFLSSVLRTTASNKNPCVLKLMLSMKERLTELKGHKGSMCPLDCEAVCDLHHCKNYVTKPFAWCKVT